MFFLERGLPIAFLAERAVITEISKSLAKMVESTRESQGQVQNSTWETPTLDTSKRKALEEWLLRTSICNLKAWAPWINLTQMLQSWLFSRWQATKIWCYLLRLPLWKPQIHSTTLREAEMTNKISLILARELAWLTEVQRIFPPAFNSFKLRTQAVLELVPWLSLSPPNFRISNSSNSALCSIWPKEART